MLGVLPPPHGSLVASTTPGFYYNPLAPTPSAGSDWLTIDPSMGGGGGGGPLSASPLLAAATRTLSDSMSSGSEISGSLHNSSLPHLPTGPNSLVVPPPLLHHHHHPLSGGSSAGSGLAIDSSASSTPNASLIQSYPPPHPTGVTPISQLIDQSALASLPPNRLEAK